MEKNKGLFIALGVLFLVIVGGLGAFYIASNNKTVPAKFTPGSADNNQNNTVAPTISPDEIGFNLALAQTGKRAGHAINMQITKIDGITAIDYEFSYKYAGDLNQGGFGHFDIK